MSGKNYCQSCGLSNFNHINSWVDELSRRILPPIKLPTGARAVADIFIEKLFTIPGFAGWRDDFTDSDIQLRTYLFVEEMRKRGASCWSLHSFAGFTSHIKMEMNGKIFRFEGIPTAEFMSRYDSRIVDDKELARKHMTKGGFPAVPGRSFWFWQKNKALRFGKSLGFPLVVKPRAGSVSRHVTTNIQDIGQLSKAIDFAGVYSPSFIVEKFIPNTSVIRATVIDFDFVVCVRQVPANIVGNGISTIRGLIDIKNNEPNRGQPDENQFTLYKIIENEVTENLLKEAGLNYQSIPKKDELIYLQKDPFLKLGGDLIEITPDVHPENVKLFRDLARHFDIRITGIDFLIDDISRSWKEQNCAVLELNSLPCIELHHYPYSGKPTNPAKALADMFVKYYL